MKRNFNSLVRDSLVRYLQKEGDLTCFRERKKYFLRTTLPDESEIPEIIDKLNDKDFTSDFMESREVRLYKIWNRFYHTNYVLTYPFVEAKREKFGKPEFKQFPTPPSRYDHKFSPRGGKFQPNV